MNINSSYDDGEDDDDELLIPEIVVVPTKVKMATSAALSHAQDSNSWECEHDCGFRDKSIATVEKHELTCASNPASSPHNPIYADDSDGDLDYIDALEEGNINDALLEGAPSPAGSAPASRRRLRRPARGNGNMDRFAQKEGANSDLIYTEDVSSSMRVVSSREHQFRNLQMHPALDCGTRQEGSRRVAIRQPLKRGCVQFADYYQSPAQCLLFFSLFKLKLSKFPPPFILILILILSHFRLMRITSLTRC